jgi:hypothetical protein
MKFKLKGEKGEEFELEVKKVKGDWVQIFLDGIKMADVFLRDWDKGLNFHFSVDRLPIIAPHKNYFVVRTSGPDLYEHHKEIAEEADCES